MESRVDFSVRGSGHSFTRKDAGHNLDYEIWMADPSADSQILSDVRSAVGVHPHALLRLIRESYGIKSQRRHARMRVGKT